MTEDEIQKFIDELLAAAPDLGPGASRERHRFEVLDVRIEGLYATLRIDVDEPAWRDSYTRPGQYVTLKIGEADHRYMAIANSPERARAEGWEFLVDVTEKIEEAVTTLRPGDHVLVSQAEGPGYPTEMGALDHVLMFVTGTGVASVRPVLQYWVDHPEHAPGDVVLYYGESRPEDFAYGDELATWASEHGVVVEQVAESVEDPHAFRYVQQVYEARGPRLENAAIYLCGAPVMMRVVARTLLEQGLSPDLIHTNLR